MSVSVVVLDNALLSFIVMLYLLCKILCFGLGEI